MVTLTWVGHGTVAVATPSLRLVTDPLLTRRVAHLRRRAPLDPRAVEGTQVVLLTHAHLDHLHLPSLRRLGPEVRIVAPAGTGRLLARLGVRRVDEVLAGASVDLGGAIVHAVPANHRAGRGPHSRVQAEPIGYVVQAGQISVYVAGDTDLFEEMSSLAGVTVAALPIWGWGPSIGPGHLDPERALEAVRRMRPEHVLPVHWGTYAPEDARRRRPAWFDRPGAEFARLMHEHGWANRLHLLAPGGHFAVVPRP